MSGRLRGTTERATQLGDALYSSLPIEPKFGKGPVLFAQNRNGVAFTGEITTT